MSLTVSCVLYKKCPAPRISAGAGFLCRLAAGLETVPAKGGNIPVIIRAVLWGRSLFRVWFDGCVSYMI